ncbi:hypothetical protein BC835DRAFT_1410581 [Cytidiella melzeri]|nr:hypothetical protein BC835DRAFT_1410581 [Cytidiella melzeri]
MPLWFYHVGGFYSHIQRNAHKIPLSAKDIADKLLGPKVNIKVKEDGGLQFFLGITPCGASYVLLSQRAVDSDPYLRGLFNGRAWSSNQFVSLSPVHFADANALSMKIAMLTNKKRKDHRDRSQANVAFTSGISDISTLQQVGIDRANFEYHRVLYQLCRGTIDPCEYDATRVSWFNDIDTMWSFAYNTWNSDRRSLAERQQDPKILDISWTEYIPPSSSDGLIAIKTNHYALKENRVLGNPTRANFLHGETETGSREEIASSLQKIFVEAKRNRPVLLFVHDTKWAMLILRSFGVDTSEWRRGIEPVLGRPLLEMPSARDIGESSNNRDRGRDVRSSDRYSYDPRNRSERSRSPGWGRSSTTRNRSPPAQQKSPHPVYVVDVKNLYIRMRQISADDGATSIAEIAHALRVNFERPEQSEESLNARPSSLGWCAGNESRALGYLWSAMVSGNAIDEQRLARFNRIVHQTHLEQSDTKAKAVVAPPAPIVPAVVSEQNDSDSDRDPNDIVARVPSSRPNIMSGHDPYASDEDDYLDY